MYHPAQTRPFWTVTLCRSPSLPSRSLALSKSSLQHCCDSLKTCVTLSLLRRANMASSVNVIVECYENNFLHFENSKIVAFPRYCMWHVILMKVVFLLTVFIWLFLQKRRNSRRPTDTAQFANYIAEENRVGTCKVFFFYIIKTWSFHHYYTLSTCTYEWNTVSSKKLLTRISITKYKKSDNWPPLRHFPQPNQPVEHQKWIYAWLEPGWSDWPRRWSCSVNFATQTSPSWRIASSRIRAAMWRPDCFDQERAFPDRLRKLPGTVE